AYWFENPKGKEGYWKRYLIHSKVDNESPHFYDINHDGKMELVFQTDHLLGFAQRQSEDVTLPWEFIVLNDGIEAQKFTHGFGIGDIDGDGQEDILMANGWYRNPGGTDFEDKWQFTKVDFGIGGAQMYTYDVNGD